MPLVDVTLVAGRTPEQIRDLIDRLTDAVEQSVDAPRANIRVIVREVPASHWAAGGETVAERRARA
jgi:4-oxalocrotonate tautomerase